MNPFYTRGGDDGNTGFLGKGRLPKEHPRIEAVGALDEANAAIGMARAVCHGDPITAILITVQRDLYNLMAEVAAEPEEAVRFRKIDATRITWLEQQIEILSTRVKIPSEFILPGDTGAGAVLDFSRAVVRRAERCIAGLLHAGLIENQALLVYLNRLSSLCFILELLMINQSGMSQPTLAKE